MRVRGKNSGVVMNLPESLAHGLLRDGSVELVTRAPVATPEPEPEVQEELAPSLEPEPGTLVCNEPGCGATAKSGAGMAAHRRSKHQ